MAFFLQTLTTNPARRRLFERWAREHRLNNRLAVALIMASLVAVAVTFATFAGFPPFGPNATAILVLLLVDSVLLLGLSLVVLQQIGPLWTQRKAGLAGSRLHKQLLLLFSVLAITPTLILLVFTTVFFHFGMEQWFSKRVGTALDASLAVADAYLGEHQNIIRADAVAAANDINRQAPWLLDAPADQLAQVLMTQAVLRSLVEATIIDSKENVIADIRPDYMGSRPPLSERLFSEARQGQVVLFNNAGGDRVYALIKLDNLIDSFLFIGRPVDPQAIEHAENTRQAVNAYRQAESQRGWVQVGISFIIIIVGLLLLLAATWVALRVANRFVGPISDLVTAAEDIRSGNLDVAVRVPSRQDELRTLTLAFNRMTTQLAAQRRQLLETNNQLDERRRFIEAVLAGVSAGVIGLDAGRRLSAANRRASSLLEADLTARYGQPLDGLFTEVQPLLDRAATMPGEGVQEQLSIERQGRTRILLLRVVAELADARITGFVMTFDDITDLIRAQKTAAWADVARRLAHEIKNPLTPIQLSAERLQRRYLKQITNDPETFQDCTRTIIRQVEDLERLVSEFSDFARMPAPHKQRDNLALLCRQIVSFLHGSFPGVTFVAETPEDVQADHDAGMVRQALTNLLKNAAEAIAESGQPGTVTLSVAAAPNAVTVTVRDDGPGWPEKDLDRLLEPYVTTKPKGTGLGLAIVKKIVEEHHGFMKMQSCVPKGAQVVLTLPQSPDRIAT